MIGSSSSSGSSSIYQLLVLRQGADLSNQQTKFHNKKEVFFIIKIGIVTQI